MKQTRRNESKNPAIIHALEIKLNVVKFVKLQL